MARVDMAQTTPAQNKADAAILGPKGEACAECGKTLEPDQRYCLNCGHRRAAPRVDFEQHLTSGDPEASEASEGAEAAPAAGGSQLSPWLAVAVLVLFGAMLLLGVMIGKDDNDESSTTTVPATTPTTATAPATTTPPAATATTPPAPGTAAPIPPAATGDAAQGGAIAPEAEAEIPPPGRGP